jgi:iron complex outermembrane receptor protein
MNILRGSIPVVETLATCSAHQILSGRPALKRSLLVATALAGTVGAAFAQTATNPLVPASSTPAKTTLEEVVVTAQRRSERLQDVPVAVTAISSRDLARAHIDDASRLEFLTPGLTWGQQGSDSFPAIRGARTSLVSAQNDPIIGFYLDGIYQSRTQQQSIPLFDLSRVEVQRGPQGTLYGRNTFGGNISVVTAPPNNTYSAAINGEYGNYNETKVDGYVNFPLASNLDLRIAAVHIGHDGYVHSATTPNVTLDDDNENAERAEIKWDPTENLDVVVRGGLWQKDDAGSGSYGYKVAGTLINPNTGYQSFFGQPYAVNPSVHNGTDIVHGVDIGVPVSPGAWTNDWDYQPFEHVVEEYVSSTVSYDFGPVVLRSIDGYTRFRAHRSADNDQSDVIFQDPAAGFGSGVQEPDTRDDAFSQELQLTSKSSTPLQWIVGGYYLHDHINETYEQDITAPGSYVPGYKETTALETNAYAAYGQGSYYVVPDLLRVIGGLRYSVETKSFGFADYANGTPGTMNFDGLPYSQTSGAPTFHSLTWRAGLELTPDHNSMYYATISTGFESGGVNDTGGSKEIPSSYAPQTVRAYEVGAKNRLLQGLVQTDLSLFYNDYKNLQINVYTPQVSYFGSAGQAYSEGAEFATHTLPLPDFHVDLTAAYLYAVYTKYISGNNFYGLSNGADPVSVNLAGFTIPMSPKWKTTMAVYYDFDMGERGTISPYFSWLFSTKYYTTDYNTALDEQKSFNEFDLSLRWTSQSGKYYGELYGTNVTDVPVLYSGVVGRDERIQVSYGPPALYGFRVGAKF